MKGRQMRQPQRPPVPDGQTQTPSSWNMIPLRPARLGQSGMSGLPGQDVPVQRGRQQLLPYHTCLLLGSQQKRPAHPLFLSSHPVSIAMNFSPLPNRGGLSFHAWCLCCPTFLCLDVLSCMPVCKLLLILQEPAEMHLLPSLPWAGLFLNNALPLQKTLSMGNPQNL